MKNRDPGLEFGATFVVWKREFQDDKAYLNSNRPDEEKSWELGVASCRVHKERGTGGDESWFVRRFSRYQGGRPDYDRESFTRSRPDERS
ncbi:unnamed protein product [Xylocopa violacea]|uniref:Uncharacterized protein n=1 Tax=Xylocopa violacea TaxID=135666 RepID=A0ABP1PEK0_XYLVO